MINGFWQSDDMKKYGLQVQTGFTREHIENAVYSHFKYIWVVNNGINHDINKYFEIVDMFNDMYDGDIKQFNKICDYYTQEGWRAKV